MKKHLYIVLLSLLVASCVKDKSTSGDHPLPAVLVSGIADTLSIYTHRDTLNLTPEVSNENNYTYYWTVVSTNFVVTIHHDTPPIPDTISRTKNISYPMDLNPGQYLLAFNVVDKQTGVTTILPHVMNVSTLNMNGWYLLKDDGAKTDFDFIYPTGRIDNWIAANNNGKSLAGTAVKAVFTPSCKMSVTSSDLFNGLMVISNKDAGLYRIDNGQAAYTADNMFFSPPSTRNFQNVIQPQQTNYLELINDNHLYYMLKGALFTDMLNTYKPSAIAASAAMDVGFDELTKSVICYNMPNYSPLGANGDDLKNMNGELIWVAGYAGYRSIALTLFRMADGSGMLIKLNGSYGYLAGYTSPLIMVSDTLPATAPIMSADVIAGNYESDYVYYAKGNNVYLTDLNSNQQTLQESYPAGEKVTCMQHILYPQPVSTTPPPTTDCLAIATYNSSTGQYKVYLHKLSTTGTFTPQTTPNFTGNGRVASITYMEQGNGSRAF